MKRVSKYLIIAFISLSFIAAKGQALTEYDIQINKYYIIRLSDRLTLLGQCTLKDSVSLTLKTYTIEFVRILYSNISNFEEIDSALICRGRYWFPNPDVCRYFIAPSAYLHKSKDGRLQSTYGVVNQLEMGVHKHLTIGVGAEMTSLLAPVIEGNEFKPSYGFSVKTGLNVAKKVDLGLGCLQAAIFNYSERRYTRNNFGYLNGTFGNTDHHMTGILGLRNSNKKQTPTRYFGFAGYTRITRKVGLILELWQSPGLSNYDAVALAGTRFFGRRLSCDFGFVYVGPNDIFPAIPYLDLVLNF